MNEKYKNVKFVDNTSSRAMIDFPEAFEFAYNNKKLPEEFADVFKISFIKNKEGSLFQERMIVEWL